MNPASLATVGQNAKQNKWVRRMGIALLVLLAFWVIAWLAVPPIAKSQLQKIASEKLGRQVTVGKIDFKPWTLELTLNDLRIASADGSKPQLLVKRIYVDGELQSILRLGPVIDAVRIEAPAIALTRLANGGLDIDDILKRLAPPPDAPPAKPGNAHFAVYNIAITDGAVDFVDETVHRTQQLRDFVLKVPFLSNLDSKREIKTEPKLAFVLNGSKFETQAASTPFSENRKTDAQLSFSDLDLTPFLGYIPAGAPASLRAGKLDADLTIGFEQAATIGLRISGNVGLHQVKVADSEGRDLLGFDSLKVGLADVRPLEKVVHLGEVALAAPDLVVARDAAGRLNLLPGGSSGPGAPAGEKAGGKAEAVDPSNPAAEAKPEAGAKPAEPEPWHLQIDRVALSGGQVGWRDATTEPAAVIDLKQLEVELKTLSWPMDKPASLSGSTQVGGASLKFSGEGTDQAAKINTEISQLPLSLAEPYLAQELEPSLDGKLSVNVDLLWTKPDIKVVAHSVVAESLALTHAKVPVASIGRLEIAEAQVDLAKRALAVGSVKVSSPKIAVERDNQRRWMFEQWLKKRAAGAPEAASGSGPARSAEAAPAGAGAGAAPAGGNPSAGANAGTAQPGNNAPGGAAAAPWTLALGSFALDNGTVNWTDNTIATPVTFDLTALNLELQKIAPDTANVSPLKFSGRISAGRADPGRLEYEGSLVLKPISTEGRLTVAGFPAHLFKAYFTDALNVDIRRAFASYKGTVKFALATAGPTVRLAGDSSLDDFRATSTTLAQAPGVSGNDRLLSWKTLALRGLQVNLAPNTAPTLDVRETTLSDFFARIIIDPTGRLNLQNLVKKSADQGQSAQLEVDSKRSLGGTNTTTAKATPPAAASGGTVGRRAAPPRASTEAAPAELMVGGGPAAVPAAAVAPAAPADPLAPVISFGPMNLVNGRIDFSDFFIKPNYSADLTELNGKLSAFSSRPQGDKPALADLELRGKAQQTASLAITGKLNPLAKPLELDITAQMHDLDLPPLSPYTIRFAGHGIERGKLSMDVNYKIAPDGALTASNKLVLNQLQFGEEVQGAPASLPVKLAVALLSDRNGVIDVDLPLRGSINDPQFSIGPLILKAFVNLIVKAVTAPFSLLGGLGGGAGGDSSTIVFAPGSSELSPEASQSLDKVAKALQDRPALQLTVAGTASLEQERDAYLHQRLRELAMAEKRRVAVRADQDPAKVPPLTDAEYPELLTAVYKRADLKKPRNMVGLTKDLPLKDMEDLLMASITVDDETMRQLALQRGAAVRDYLLTQKLPSERLFLGAVSTKAAGDNWKPGAELKLATR